MTALRTRTVRAGFWSDEDLSELPLFTRFVFIGLMVVADREGRFENRPRRIKRLLFPCDEIDIEAAITALAGAGFIELYVVNGQRLAEIRNFGKHQRPHPAEAKSVLPPIPLDPMESNGTSVDPSQSPPEPSGSSAPSETSETSGVPVRAVGGGSGGNRTDSASPTSASPSNRESGFRSPTRWPLSANWKPNEQHRRLALQEKVNLSAETAAFRDYHLAKGSIYTDWDAAFNSWLRKASRFATEDSRPGPSRSPSRSQRIIGAGLEALRLLDEAEEDTTTGGRP
jgi:hypothetical protein